MMLTLPNIQDSTLDQRQQRRKLSRRARHFRSVYSRAGRIAARGPQICQRATSSVKLGYSTAGAVHVTGGVQRCASMNCDVCGPMIREGRAQEIDAAARLLMSAGKALYFATFTVPHNAADSADWLIKRTLKAYSATWTGGPAARFRKQVGWVGQIRYLEVTAGRPGTEHNGWHPHIHALIILDSHVDMFHVEQFARQQWQTQVTKHLGRPIGAKGVDVQAVKSTGDLSKYLTKVDDGWGVGLELARGDVKKSENRLSSTQLLHEATRQFDETGELVDIGAENYIGQWLELDNALLGVRIGQWTPKLRDYIDQLADDYSGSEADVLEAIERWRKIRPLDDEDLAKGDLAEMIAETEIDGEVWTRAVNRGDEWKILVAFEWEHRSKLIEYRAAHPPDPPDLLVA